MKPWMAVAKGFMDQTMSNVEEENKRNAKKADKYEEAIVAMRMKGQEERTKQYKDEQKARQGIMKGMYVNPNGALKDWFKLNNMTGYDDYLESYNKNADKKGHYLVPDWTDQDVIEFLKADQEQWSKLPPPSEFGVDDIESVKYTDAAEYDGVMGSLRKMLGTTPPDLVPVTPAAGAAALAKKYHEQERQQASRMADPESFKQFANKFKFREEPLKEKLQTTKAQKFVLSDGTELWAQPGTGEYAAYMKIPGVKVFNTSTEKEGVQKGPSAKEITDNIPIVTSRWNSLYADALQNDAGLDGVTKQRMALVQEWMEAPEDSPEKSMYHAMMTDAAYLLKAEYNNNVQELTTVFNKILPGVRVTGEDKGWGFGRPTPEGMYVTPRSVKEFRDNGGKPPTGKSKDAQADSNMAKLQARLATDKDYLAAVEAKKKVQASFVSEGKYNLIVNGKVVKTIQLDGSEKDKVVDTSPTKPTTPDKKPAPKPEKVVSGRPPNVEKIVSGVMESAKGDLIMLSPEERRDKLTAAQFMLRFPDLTKEERAAAELVIRKVGSSTNVAEY